MKHKYPWRYGATDRQPQRNEDAEILAVDKEGWKCFGSRAESSSVASVVAFIGC